MRVHIRPLQKSDAEVSVKWRNIPEIWTFTTFKTDREITLKDEQTWINKVISDPTSARFAILADEVYVGNIYLTNIEGGAAEYHIFIGDKNYWGKGIASTASVLILEYARDVLKLDTVYLYVKQENTGAYHIYSKLGFALTKKKRDDFVNMELDLHHWDGKPRATIEA